MTDQRVAVAWPPRALNPNSRAHWAAKARASSAYKAAAAWCCKLHKVKPMAGAIHCTVTFHPPDNRRRDSDNLLRACKPATDAIAAAVGVDDARWEFTTATGPKVRGGKVEYRLTEKTKPPA